MLFGRVFEDIWYVTVSLAKLIVPNLPFWYLEILWNLTLNSEAPTKTRCLTKKPIRIMTLGSITGSRTLNKILHSFPSRQVEATFLYNLVTLLDSLVTSVRLDVCCCILTTVQQEICWPTFYVYFKSVYGCLCKMVIFFNFFCFYVLLVIVFNCVLQKY